MATSSLSSSIADLGTDQTIGGYPAKVFLNLNTTQEDHLTCGYCKQIVRNPVFCPSMCKQGHRYCQSCFSLSMVQDQNFEAGMGCEKCREAIKKLKQLPADATAPQINQIFLLDNALKKSLGTLQTKCLNEP